MSRFTVASIKLTFFASTFSAKAKSHSQICTHFEIASFQTLFSAIASQHDAKQAKLDVAHEYSQASK
jgi:hypothetical protein